MKQRVAITLVLALNAPVISFGETAKAIPSVRLQRVPGGGIQPQTAVDGKGILHLLYYSGDPRHGNLFYSRSLADGLRSSEPVRVNSQEGSVIAVGTIRGGQMAIGNNGRLHVAWNGSGEAEPQGPINLDSGQPGAPMLYTRMSDRGGQFEPQRNLMRRSFGLDGGGSLAADSRGNVYVAWHGIGSEDAAVKEAGLKGEARRRVWLARSTDDGRSFSSEVSAWPQLTGACACCGMKAFAAQNGTLYTLYRSATESVHRDIYLLVSDGQHEARGTLLHRWDINACPMSSMDFAENSKSVVGAWETGGQVYWAWLNHDQPGPTEPIAPPGEARGRKHPRVAMNHRGEVLLVWTEGTAWQRGGSVAWQLYKGNGQPVGQQGQASGVPAWSFAAAVARPDGDFVILY